MRVFDYLPSPMSYKDQLAVYEVVQNLAQYAKVIYRNGWEDALDASFFHIIKHYKKVENGDLEHYAIVIVKNIDLGKYTKEIPSEDVVSIGLDEKAYADHMLTPEEVKKVSTDLEDCMHDLVPYFIRDFKFFCTQQSKDRKLKYHDIFVNYQPAVVGKAMQELLKKHKSRTEAWLGYSKKMNIHSFSKDRYVKSIDESLEYRGKLNETLLVKRKTDSHSKKIWKSNLGSVLEMLYNTFYKEDSGIGALSIEGRVFYLTTSGKIVEGYESLMERLESELVGSILSRTSLKVLMYDKGKDLFLSSTKDEQYPVVLDIFDGSIVITFDLVSVKEV